MTLFKIDIVGTDWAGWVLARSLLDTAADVPVFEDNDTFDA